MRSLRIPRPYTTAILALFVCLVSLGSTPATPLAEQTIELQPGWNAIWLEVQPEPDDVGSVFAGVPLVSLWTWQPRTSTVEFIRDPDEGLLNHPGWLGYFPPGPEHFLTNLHTVRANRAYLVLFPQDVAPMTLTVAGRPSLRSIDWVPNSFNLVGLPVDPQRSPTFGEFLGPSPAHAGQPIYRLVAGGRWEPVSMPHAETIAAGEAYWIYSEGASEYTGPVGIELDWGDGLDFGARLVERRLHFRGLAGDARELRLRPIESASPLPLSYWTLETETDPDTGEPYTRAAWRELEAEHTIEVAGDEEVVLRLAVRRSELPGEAAEAVLELTDGAGTRRLLPLTAISAAPSLAPHEGLWVGSVTVDAVSEPASDDPFTPTPTSGEFSFRLLIHVDGNGETRLLKQIFQLWQEDDPGHYALITDDDLLPQFGGGTAEDDPASFRMSTPAYDFDDVGASVAGTLDMTGNFEIGGSPLACDIQLVDVATNPFRHRYHPDHADGYDVTRSWTLAFAAEDPDGQNPEWGASLMGGTFEETITGLHRDSIQVEGTFRLRHVSDISTLNQ